MPISYNIFLLALAVGLFCSSCAPLSRPGVERTHYLVQVQRPTTAEEVSPLGLVLAVRPARVAPGFDGRPFVTVTEDGRAETDFHHHFFLPPGDMLAAQVRQWLADARLFTHVTDLSSLKQPDLILETYVPTLSRRIGPFPARAVLAVQFLLLRPERDASATIVMQGDYRREVPLQYASASGLVRAWEDALQQIMGDFEADLRQGLESFPRGDVPARQDP